MQEKYSIKSPFDRVDLERIDAFCESILIKKSKKKQDLSQRWIPSLSLEAFQHIADEKLLHVVPDTSKIIAVAIGFSSYALKLYVPETRLFIAHIEESIQKKDFFFIQVLISPDTDQEIVAEMLIQGYLTQLRKKSDYFSQLAILEQNNPPLRNFLRKMNFETAGSFYSNTSINGTIFVHDIIP